MSATHDCGAEAVCDRCVWAAFAAQFGRDRATTRLARVIGQDAADAARAEYETEEA